MVSLQILWPSQFTQIWPKRCRVRRHFDEVSCRYPRTLYHCACGVRPMPLRMAGRRAFYPSALWAGGVVSSRSGRARGCQNLWHPYLWNRLTDFLRSKFCGIVLPCSCALLWSYAHLLAHRPKTCQICHKLASDVVARISLKLLDGFSPFEVSWTCLQM